MIDMYNMESERNIKHCCPMINHGTMCPKMMESNVSHGSVHPIAPNPPCMYAMNNQWNYDYYNLNSGYMHPEMNYNNLFHNSMYMNPMMLRMNQNNIRYPYVNMRPVTIEELQD